MSNPRARWQDKSLFVFLLKLFDGWRDVGWKYFHIDEPVQGNIMFRFSQVVKKKPMKQSFDKALYFRLRRQTFQYW